MQDGLSGAKPRVSDTDLRAAFETAQERVEVMRVCAEVNAGRVPLLSGLIGGSTDAMIAHGRDLLAAGAQGFCVFPPMPVFIGAPIPAEMIRRFHGDIAQALKVPLIADEDDAGSVHQELDAFVAEVRKVTRGENFPSSFASREEWQRTIRYGYHWLRMGGYFDAYVELDEIRDLLTTGGAQPSARPTP